MVRRRRDQRDAGGGAAQRGDLGRYLVAGQLPALAGLGALGDLDLQHVGVHQVVRTDAEAPGGDLLDAGVALAVETRRVFAAFAGIGPATQAVHRDRQRFVGFRGQRADGHRRGVETGVDAFFLLDAA